MKFDSFEELQQSLEDGHCFESSGTIEVNDVIYRKVFVSMFKSESIVECQLKLENDEDAHTIRFHKQSGGEYGDLFEMVADETESIVETETVPVETSITLLRLSDKPIGCKVDTGATMCCLHADNVQTKGNQVQFELNNRRFKMNLHDTVNVQNTHGESERACISLDVNFNGQVVKDVIFNLSDRSEMDEPILVGMNLLKKAGVVIDPNE